MISRGAAGGGLQAMPCAAVPIALPACRPMLMAAALASDVGFGPGFTCETLSVPCAVSWPDTSQALNAELAQTTCRLALLVPPSAARLTVDHPPLRLGSARLSVARSVNGGPARPACDALASIVAKTSIGLAAQIIKQRLCVFQIGNVEAFGEPVVEINQHILSLLAMVSLREEPG
jgi:hypothetical protein